MGRMVFYNLLLIWLTLFLIVFGSCTVEKDKITEPLISVDVPEFNADSAYFYIDKQVKFGPRIPNSQAHLDAASYLIDHFRKCGALIVEQKFVATSFDNQKLNLRNIIASFHPDASKRILLAAHWDTRPFADKDPDRKNAPFDGANDGASGVGVLMEIARVLGRQDSLAVGVDIILFDGEDWGEPDGTERDISLPEELESWWCLGSQYWAKNKHKKNYSASFGILLDMVGARRAQFYREGVSMEYAPKIVDKVWTTAHGLGYSDYFVKENVPAITDDHLFVNQLARIPMINVVPYRAGTGFFGEYHHTRGDNMTLINKETLKAVGSTLLHVIFYEKE